MKLVFSRQALHDLADIKLQGTREFGLEVSEKYQRQLRRKFQIIKFSPEIARVHPDLPRGLRMLPAGSHVIFYSATEGQIDIFRVVHGRQNWKEMF